METKLTDFAVIGLGGMGSAALYHLSLTGARVTGFDQFDPPHDLGSSHGQTRIYRKLYFEHPNYVPMLLEAEKLILETEKYSGINFFFRRPCLSVGADKPGTVFSGALESAKIYNLKHRVADAVSIKNDFPFIRLPKHYKACIDPEAGIMIPEECIRAHLKLAEANAAVVHRQTLIQEVNDTGNGFEIIANNIKYNARTLIVTAGAWTSKILPRLPVKLTVTREVMTFLETDKSLHSVKGLPSVIMSEDNGDEFYGIFALDGTHFKGGNHSFNPKKQADPDFLERNTAPDEGNDYIEVMKRLFGEVMIKRQQSKVCMYTHSPDGDFIIDRAENPNMIYACGFSGHGFKFTPIIGKILKNMACNESPACDIKFLSAARFAGTV